MTWRTPATLQSRLAWGSALWYSAPESTYLVEYVEATDAFLAEDVRDIVDRQ